MTIASTDDVTTLCSMIAQDWTNGRSKAAVATLVGEDLLASGAEFQAQLCESLRSSAQGIDMLIVSTEALAAGDSIDQAIALEILDRLPNVNRVQELRQIAAGSNWNVGMRRTFVAGLAEFVSDRKLVLVCFDFDDLGGELGGAFFQMIGWFGRRIGAQGILLRTRQQMSGSDREYWLPEKSRIAFVQDASKRVAGEIEERCRDANLIALTERFAEIVFPSFDPVERLALNLPTALKQVEETAEHLSELEKATLRTRTAFVLMLQSANPEFVARIRAAKHWDDELFRMQLTLSESDSRSETTAGLLDRKWSEYVNDPLLRSLFRLLASEGKRGDVPPFASPESIKQHFAFVSGGSRPEGDKPARIEWEEWLKKLRGWADGCFDEVHEQFKAHQNLQRKFEREQERARSSAQWKEIRGKLAELPRAGTEATAPYALAVDLHQDLQSLLANLANEAEAPIPFEPHLPASVVPPLSASGWFDSEINLDLVARYLFYADVVRTDAEVTRQVEKLADQLKALRAKVVDSALRFEAGILQARALALCGLHDDATRTLDMLDMWKDQDPICQSMKDLTEAFILEHRGKLSEAEKRYETVLAECKRTGVHELAARAAFGRVRCAEAAKTRPELMRIYRATVLVAIAAERSPRLARAGLDRPQVFVSYRRKDNLKVANALLEIEPTPACEIWVDRFQIDDAKHDFGPILLMALERSDAVVVLFSGSYFHSRWCMFELDTALARARTGAIELFWTVAGADPERVSREEDLRKCLTESAAPGDTAYFEDRISRVLRLSPNGEPASRRFQPVGFDKILTAARRATVG